MRAPALRQWNPERPERSERSGLKGEQCVTSTSPSDQPRVVLVAGGTSGIGAAIAEAFSQLGDRVAVTGKTEEEVLA